MPKITCARCKRETDGYEKTPLPGPLSDEILAHACPSCFQEWMAQEIMIINEYRLDLAKPENQEKLNSEMARFLCLPSADGEAAPEPFSSSEPFDVMP